MEDKKTMTNEQLMRIENSHNRMARIEDEKKRVRLEIKTKQLEKTVRDREIKILQNEINLAYRKLEELDERVETRKKAHAEIIGAIKKELEIECDNWGFHPETGEIVEEKDIKE